MSTKRIRLTGLLALIDNTLTKAGFLADAKAVGDKLNEKITAPATAEVGQVISVKSVDQNGVPTEFEAVKMSAGSSDSSTSGSGLPTVTADDNGKMLRVIDASWAVVEVTDITTLVSAEEVRF